MKTEDLDLPATRLVADRRVDVARFVAPVIRIYDRLGTLVAEMPLSRAEVREWNMVAACTPTMQGESIVLEFDDPGFSLGAQAWLYGPSGEEPLMKVALGELAIERGPRTVATVAPFALVP